MGVGDHQLHPGKAAPDQAAQELAPEGLGLGRAHVQADDLPLAGGVHAVADHQGPVLDPSAGPHLLHLGVQPQIRVDTLQGRSRNAVTCSSSPRHSRERVSLEIPASPRASTSRSTLRVETPSTWASWTTATRACSLRRRGSRKLGNYDPTVAVGWPVRSSRPGCPRPAGGSRYVAPPAPGCARRSRPQRPPLPQLAHVGHRGAPLVGTEAPTILSPRWPAAGQPHRPVTPQDATLLRRTSPDKRPATAGAAKKRANPTKTGLILALTQRKPTPCAGSRAPHADPGPHDATGAAPHARRW
jgi:hypothetical protein